MDTKIVKSGMQPASVKLVIVQGVVQNLPEIIGAIKEIYALKKKEQLSSRVLQSQLEELNVNKENFRILVEGLTELSKSEGADTETKVFYRDMIKDLFETFVTNMRQSRGLSNFLEES